ncbi:MAG: transposase, partial [Adlercreutzia sp.]|nr:transposase [Adlercreutzia sp.]
MTTYTPEYRRETADYIISTGRPVRQVAEELGINYKTANNWVVARKKQLSGEAPTTEVDADLVAAQKRIRELEMENAFLKKSRSLLRERPSVNDKYRLMYAEKENFPVKLMARILEVRLSVGRTGSCHDNAVAESFFANLKNEMYHRQKFSARVEARRALV